MGYEGSYTWRLRQHVGHELLVMPGAQVVVVDAEERMLFQRRRDSGEWEFPGGAAEPGSSFRSTAVQELFEEAGLRVRDHDLVPFASLSEPDVHVITYPNGDRMHCFALCFEARCWDGQVRVEPEEVAEVTFRRPDDAPEPLQAQTRVVLELYLAYRASGVFQAR
ncbi:NUDIX hydrolase [Kribbella flavida DSM 17836]|uniref:NUDIX hydrolase n=1 Tax=Kribbella flavida (strain DSM 17836 / JCM 10339 / NBRC 14399) TaxID=479435 RepID=D2Q1T1_KRIFD|nr:NUDIX domain-containing protein [Kribbella flavida]ADB32070.1 NUDIX hydrolase [Kribbella flavida DSM 17836]